MNNSHFSPGGHLSIPGIGWRSDTAYVEGLCWEEQKCITFLVAMQVAVIEGSLLVCFACLVFPIGHEPCAGVAEVAEELS